MPKPISSGRSFQNCPFRIGCPSCVSPRWASQYVVPSLYPVWSPLKVFGQRARCVVLKPPARCLQPPSPLPHPRTSKVDMTRRHVHVHAPARFRNLLNPIIAVRCRDPGGLGWWGGVHEPRCIHLSLTNPTHKHSMPPHLLTSCHFGDTTSTTRV